MAKNDVDEAEDVGAAFEDNEDGLVVRMGEVKAQSFDALPANTYNAIISDAEYQLSKSSGKPMWNLQLAVTDAEYENRRLFTFLSFSEKALPGTKAALAIIKPELSEATFNVKDPETVSSLIGTKVKVKVAVEEYEGSKQNRIKRWYVAEGDDGFAS